MSIQNESHVPEYTLRWRLVMSLDESEHSRGSLARALDYSPSQITRWTRGDGAPKLPVLKAWAKECKVPVEWLITGVEPDGDGPDGTVTPIRTGSRKQVARATVLPIAA